MMGRLRSTIGREMGAENERRNNTNPRKMRPLQRIWLDHHTQKPGALRVPQRAAERDYPRIHAAEGGQEMKTKGTITLPDGRTISAGQGGTYSIGADCYPITIVGWSQSGKTLFYQRATARPTRGSDLYGQQSYLYTLNPDAETEKATWRRSRGCFKPAGRTCGFVHADGYSKHTDPSF